VGSRGDPVKGIDLRAEVGPVCRGAVEREKEIPMSITLPRPVKFTAAFAAVALACTLCVPVGAQDTAPTTAPTTSPTEEAESGTADVIAGHIEENTVDGVYTVRDPRSGLDLDLSLADIHSGAHPVDSGETYHCADFTDDDGSTYDLDLYVGEVDGQQQVVEVLIHKVNGKDRLR
jgi:hypothetical protein